MSLWADLGFRENPYDVMPLPSSEVGRDLLVGREKELRTLKSQLRSLSLHSTLEGANGVGKTSIVRVALFEALTEYFEGTSSQLLIPVQDLLQIGTDPSAFERRAYFALAQSIIASKGLLSEADRVAPDTADLERWLNSPMIQGGGGGLSVLGTGINAQVQPQPNVSAGFSDAGFVDVVREAIREIFPNRESGAFVCIVDNMELLQLSRDAKRSLEEVRDTVLSLVGVKWVLCGANGIIRAAVSSPRLTGRLAVPLEIEPVKDSDIDELIQARLTHFASDGATKVPVGPVAFRHLYDLLNRNLRDTLKYSEDFCIWLEIEGELGKPETDFPDLLEVWIAAEAEKINNAISLQPRILKFFDDLCREGGTCAPGDHEAFGFNTMQQMRTNLVQLERADLVISEIDESDQRRRTISITSKGWVVRYARNGFEVEPRN